MAPSEQQGSLAGLRQWHCEIIQSATKGWCKNNTEIGDEDSASLKTSLMHLGCMIGIWMLVTTVMTGNRPVGNQEINPVTVGEGTGSPERRVVGQDGLATQIACSVRSNQERCCNKPKCTIPPGDPGRVGRRDPQPDGFNGSEQECPTNFEQMHLWQDVQEPKRLEDTSKPDEMSGGG